MLPRTASAFNPPLIHIAGSVCVVVCHYEFPRAECAIFLFVLTLDYGDVLDFYLHSLFPCQLVEVKIHSVQLAPKLQTTLLVPNEWRPVIAQILGQAL